RHWTDLCMPAGGVHLSHVTGDADAPRAPQPPQVTGEKYLGPYAEALPFAGPLCCRNVLAVGRRVADGRCIVARADGELDIGRSGKLDRNAEAAFGVDSGFAHHGAGLVENIGVQRQVRRLRVRRLELDRAFDSQVGIGWTVSGLWFCVFY